MNFRRRHKASSEVSTGALTDILFFLLIFFLIMSTLTSPNVIKLMLPKASATRAVSKQALNVSITKDLQYYIEKQPVSKENLSAEIQSRIQKMGVEEPTIVIRAELGVPIEYAVEVLDIANQLKVKVLIATQKK